VKKKVNNLSREEAPSQDKQSQEITSEISSSNFTTVPTLNGPRRVRISENSQVKITGQNSSDSTAMSFNTDTRRRVGRNTSRIRSDKYVVKQHYHPDHQLSGQTISSIEEGDICFHLPKWDDNDEDDWIPVQMVASGETGFAPQGYLKKLMPGMLEYNDWYFGTATKEEVIRNTQDKKAEGNFLVYKTNAQEHVDGYVLYFVYQGNCLNVQISKTRDQSNRIQFRLQNNCSETVQGLIAQYRQNGMLQQSFKIQECVEVGTFGVWEIPAHQLALQKILGSGKYGTVHKGLYDNGLGVVQTVAIKTLKSDDDIGPDITEFKKEFSAMRKLKHRNLVSLIGANSDKTAPMLVMEFVEGGCLLDFLKNPEPKIGTRGKICFKDFIKISNDVVSGMAYMEQQKVFHRDLRAANVLVEIENKPMSFYEITSKICDFGLAGKRNLFSDGMEPDQEGTKVPIPWMAPEIIRANIDSNHCYYNTKADVWSCGCLMVEMMTEGKIPWLQATSLFRNFNNIASYLSTDDAKHPIPEGFVNGLREKTVIEQLWKLCFVYNPDRRATFKEVQDYLDTVRT